jgi:hypothetical protein
MAEKELWDILIANVKDGGVLDMLNFIANTLHENAGLVVNISAAEKVANGSYNYFT